MWPCTIVGWEKLSIKVVSSLKIHESAWVSIKLHLILGWAAYLKNIGFSETVTIVTFCSGLLLNSTLFYFKWLYYRSLPIFVSFWLWKVHIHKSQLSTRHFDLFPVSFAFHIEWSHFSSHSPPAPLIPVPSLQTSPVDFDPKVPKLCVPTLRPHKTPLEWSPLPSFPAPFLPDFIHVPSRGCLFDYSNAYRTLPHHYSFHLIVHCLPLASFW